MFLLDRFVWVLQICSINPRSGNNKKFILMATISLSAVITLAVLILLVVFLSGSNNRVRASVVTNGYGCSEIGIDVLQRGGNAVDAAIAALFCDGVSMPHSMGLGGGFLLTLYNKSTGEVWSLNSREVAPGAATVEMFQDDPKLAQTGGLAVAVPGELLGYWYVYNKFGGNLPWGELVKPTIDLCKNGIYVTAYLEDRFENSKGTFFADPVLREIFIDPDTNDTYKRGQYVRRPRLAKTLEIIATEGGRALHNGSLTEDFVNDIREHNGVITVEDMKNYEPEWKKPVQAIFNGNQVLYSSPLPGSGNVLIFILNILNGFLNTYDPFTVTNYQRITESFKFAYGMRTNLGDQNFVNISDLINNFTSTNYAEQLRRMIFDEKTFIDPVYYGAYHGNVEDSGTAHISVLAPNGDAVSVTSTINSYFGAKFASNSTGIILNNEMDDFSFPNVTNLYNLPPSPANFMQPGKRPLSSMCPTIVVNENKEVILVIGAAGGSKITTTVAQIIFNHLWYGLDLRTVMERGRIHHQLFPMNVNFEIDFQNEFPDIVNGLKAIGHNISISGPSDGFAAATAISNLNFDSMTGMYDKRRPGSVSYIY